MGVSAAQVERPDLDFTPKKLPEYDQPVPPTEEARVVAMRRAQDLSMLFAEQGWGAYISMLNRNPASVAAKLKIVYPWRNR